MKMWRQTGAWNKILLQLFAYVISISFVYVLPKQWLMYFTIYMYCSSDVSPKQWLHLYVRTVQPLTIKCGFLDLVLLDLSTYHLVSHTLIAPTSRIDVTQVGDFKYSPVVSFAVFSVYSGQNQKSFTFLGEWYVFGLLKIEQV